MTQPGGGRRCFGGREPHANAPMQLRVTMLATTMPRNTDRYRTMSKKISASTRTSNDRYHMPTLSLSYYCCLTY